MWSCDSSGLLNIPILLVIHPGHQGEISSRVKFKICNLHEGAPSPLLNLKAGPQEMEEFLILCTLRIT